MSEAALPPGSRPGADLHAGAVGVEQALDGEVALAGVVAERQHRLPSGISGSFCATAASAAPDDGPTKMPSSRAARTA